MGVGYREQAKGDNTRGRVKGVGYRGQDTRGRAGVEASGRGIGKNRGQDTRGRDTGDRAEGGGYKNKNYRG